MATDLQIIDGFEKLRAEYLAASDGALPKARDGVKPSDAAMEVAEAWVQAIDGKAAGAGQPMRRVRALARAFLNPDREPDHSLNTDDQKLLKNAERIRSGLERACKAGLAPVAARPKPRTCAEEAAAWRKLLPSLAGIKAWRLMERLGRPVVIPDTQLRRFLWRFGVLDEQPQTDSDLAKVQAAA
ncbi:hypothetical protein LLG95_18560, partial [bacterium]|nr:hypothetical protein [bacterium]